MHVSIAVTRIIIILVVVAAHAARSLTVQEAQVSATGSGQELRQLPRLDPGEEVNQSFALSGVFMLYCILGLRPTGQNPDNKRCCLRRQRLCSESCVTSVRSYWRLRRYHSNPHADRSVMSGRTNPVRTVCLKDLIWETNLICLQSEQSQSD